MARSTATSRPAACGRTSLNACARLASACRKACSIPAANIIEGKRHELPLLCVRRTDFHRRDAVPDGPLSKLEHGARSGIGKGGAPPAHDVGRSTLRRTKHHHDQAASAERYAGAATHAAGSAARPCTRPLAGTIGTGVERIGQQLPDALELMSRALRAGHAFPTALKMVGEEMNAPLGDEFRIAFDEVNFGIAMPDALMNLATRVPSTDVRYFVIAVLIQRETGGNLSELLDSIARIIRERMKLLGQVRVLSAEARLSAWILSLLPFAAAAVIQLTNPTFLDLLYHDPSGQKMLAGALVLMLIGIGIMRKIIHIHV